MTSLATPTRTVTSADARTLVRGLIARRLGTGATRTAVETAANDALLVASELVANAEQHGGGLDRFHAELDGASLWLSVSDHSLRYPEARATGPATPGGFGWPLIQRLCDSVTIAQRFTGKTITARLALP